MRKRMCVWGGRFFQGIVFDENLKKYLYTSNDCLSKLSDKYEITNFSMKNMDVDKALSYMNKALIFDNNYQYCIIALGEYEFNNIVVNGIRETNMILSVNSFKEKINQIIDLLAENKIKPLLVTLQPSDIIEDTLKTNSGLGEIVYNYINDAIIDVSKAKKIKLINSEKQYSTNQYTLCNFIANKNNQDKLAKRINKELKNSI